MKAQLVELGIIIFFVTILFASVTMIAMYFAINVYYENIITWLENKFPFHVVGIMQVLMGTMVFYWAVSCGGIKSKLWKWLPPFVFFSNNDFMRWLCALWLSIGGILGGLGILFGLIKPPI